jgi:hypothetical protein
MTVDATRAFDAEATVHLVSFAAGGVLELGVPATVSWVACTRQTGEVTKLGSCVT